MLKLRPPLVFSEEDAGPLPDQVSQLPRTGCLAGALTEGVRSAFRIAVRICTARRETRATLTRLCYCFARMAWTIAAPWKRPVSMNVRFVLRPETIEPGEVDPGHVGLEGVGVVRGRQESRGSTRTPGAGPAAWGPGGSRSGGRRHPPRPPAARPALRSHVTGGDLDEPALEPSGDRALLDPVLDVGTDPVLDPSRRGRRAGARGSRWPPPGRARGRRSRPSSSPPPRRRACGRRGGARRSSGRRGAGLRRGRRAGWGGRSSRWRRRRCARVANASGRVRVCSTVGPES